MSVVSITYATNALMPCMSIKTNYISIKDVMVLTAN